MADLSPEARKAFEAADRAWRLSDTPNANNMYAVAMFAAGMEHALAAQADTIAAMREDAERWRMLPALEVEFQLPLVPITRAVDREIAARAAEKGTTT